MLLPTAQSLAASRQTPSRQRLVSCHPWPPEPMCPASFPAPPARVFARRLFSCAQYSISLNKSCFIASSCLRGTVCCGATASLQICSPRTNLLWTGYRADGCDRRIGCDRGARAGERAAEEARGRVGAADQSADGSGAGFALMRTCMVLFLMRLTNIMPHAIILRFCSFSQGDGCPLH